MLSLRCTSFRGSAALFYSFETKEEQGKKEGGKRIGRRKSLEVVSSVCYAPLVEADHQPNEVPNSSERRARNSGFLLKPSSWHAMAVAKATPECTVHNSEGTSERRSMGCGHPALSSRSFRTSTVKVFLHFHSIWASQWLVTRNPENVMGTFALWVCTLYTYSVDDAL